MVEGLTDTPYLGASSCTCPSRLSVCGWIITFAFCDEAPASPHLPSPPRCRVFLQRHGPLGCTQLPCVQAPLVCVCLWSKVSVSFTCRIEVPVGLGKPSPLVPSSPAPTKIWATPASPSLPLSSVVISSSTQGHPPVPWQMTSSPWYALPPGSTTCNVALSVELFLSPKVDL